MKQNIRVEETMPGNRRSIRLKDYDYTKEGAYYVTVCVNDRKCVFGDIHDGKMVLNYAGEMVQRVWNEIPKFYNGIDIDHFQIMPNHVHGIIMIVGAGPCACPENNKKSYNHGIGQPQGVAPTLSLSDVVHRFKTMTTKQYCDGVKTNNWLPFDIRLWQRNFYEHVIRGESDLNRIREYIINNPANWEEDEYYSA
ncbi:transposase [Candidatus Omnitrophota bacterium]